MQNKFLSFMRTKTSKLGKLVLKSVILSLILLCSGCSKYRGEWDCPNVKGIGCSSIEQAEKVAKEQILLNIGQARVKKITIKEHYEGFNKIPKNTIEAK